MKAICITVILAIVGTLQAQISANTAATASDMAANIFGPGVAISNAVVTPTAVVPPVNAYGTFTNGNTTDFGLDFGTVLTSGDADNINNPASFESHGGCAFIPVGNELLDSLMDQQTVDACLLEFDAVPSCTTLVTKFVFASEEYPEWVGWFNDGFGIFVSGPNPAGGFYDNMNIAVIPGTTDPVTVGSVNSIFHSSYYIDNTGDTGIVYDGMTIPITARIDVVPCAHYHIKIVIADGIDCLYDTGVFIQYEDNTYSPPVADFLLTGDTMVCLGDPAALKASGADHYIWSTGETTSAIVVYPPVTTIYSVFGYMTCDTAHGSLKTTTVHVMPIPDVTISPQNAAIVPGTGLVTLVADGAFSYIWASGDTTSSIIVSPIETTTYTVTGTGGDSIWPCTATATTIVQVVDGIYIPDAFTPNNDGLNDVFIPATLLDHVIRNYEFIIFDRWGSILFKTDDYTIGWDGRCSNGDEANQGAYAYMVTYSLIDSYETTILGHVNLIR